MLDYFALFMLFFVSITLFYAVIVIHDIPYEIAKKRNHPQQDALHVAGWVSLFTLHILWPFLWIWATLYREDRGWGFTATEGQTSPEEKGDKVEVSENSAIEGLSQEVDSLRQELASLKQDIVLASATGIKQPEHKEPATEGQA